MKQRSPKRMKQLLLVSAVLALAIAVLACLLRATHFQTAKRGTSSDIAASPIRSDLEEQNAQETTSTHASDLQRDSPMTPEELAATLNFGNADIGVALTPPRISEEVSTDATIGWPFSSSLTSPLWGKYTMGVGNRYVPRSWWSEFKGRLRRLRTQYSGGVALPTT